MSKLLLNTAVDILGTHYHVRSVSETEDKRIRNKNGFTDWTSKEICIEKIWDGDLSVMDNLVKKVIRHELIHAFMFESGFGDCFEHGEYGQEETVIDWFSFQFEKIANAIEKIYETVRWNEID